jgi:hypothetical protein
MMMMIIIIHKLITDDCKSRSDYRSTNRNSVSVKGFSVQIFFRSHIHWEVQECILIFPKKKAFCYKLGNFFVRLKCAKKCFSKCFMIQSMLQNYFKFNYFNSHYLSYIHVLSHMYTYSRNFLGSRQKKKNGWDSCNGTARETFFSSSLIISAYLLSMSLEYAMLFCFPTSLAVVRTTTFFS